MLNEANTKQIEKFISMLYHDDHDSNYFICHYKGGRMNSQRTSLEEFDISQVKEWDCYISLNGFAAYHRKQKECRQINGIVFDLDYHTPAKSEFLEWIKGKNLNCIMDAVADKKLAEPNIITDTSRGLQLIYIFENSIAYYCKDSSINSKAIYAYDKIRESIEKQIADILPKDNPLDIDKNVYDITRIVRLPGTINSKTGKRTHLIHTNEDYYSFSDFYSEKETTTEIKAPSTPKSAGYKRCNQTELQKLRIEELEKLKQIRGENCEGYRNYMTFIYYNSAVQIYDRDTAVKKTFDFADNFCSGTEAFSNFSMFEGENRFITIKFVNTCMNAVVEKIGTDKITYKNFDKDHFTVTMGTGINEQFYGWLCTFGNKAEVVEPEGQVEAFKEYLKKITSLYE